MRIGITGSSGFIGSFLLGNLQIQPGDSIRALVRSGTMPAPAHAEILQGDLLASHDCSAFVDQLDVILHLAHTNSPINSDRYPAEDTLQNLVPTLNLLQAVRKSGRKPHVVHFSSGGAIYQSSFEKRPAKETDACYPQSSYGIQKLATEHYLRVAAGRGDLTAVSLRIGNAFGTLLPSHRMQGLIGVALSAVLAGRPIRLFGSLDNVRDYIHLSDIAAMVQCVLSPREAFSVVNVGSGRGYSVSDVIAVIRSCYPGQVDVVHEAALDTGGLPNWAVLDIEKAERLYGWRPQIDLAAGIRQVLASSASHSVERTRDKPSNTSLSDSTRSR